MTDAPKPPPDDQRRGAGYRLENVDIRRLHALLSDADRIKAIGENIIKALIADVLRSKLGFDSPDGRYPLPWLDHWEDVAPPWQDLWSDTIWNRTIARVPPAIAKLFQEILTDVSLSEDELRIVRELNLRLHE
jgi:hypothetical protein